MLYLFAGLDIEPFKLFVYFIAQIVLAVARCTCSLSVARCDAFPLQVWLRNFLDLNGWFDRFDLFYCFGPLRWRLLLD